MKRYALVRGVPGRVVSKIVRDGAPPEAIGLTRIVDPEDVAEAERIKDHVGKNTEFDHEPVAVVVELDTTNAKRIRKGDLELVKDCQARNITAARRILGVKEG